MSTYTQPLGDLDSIGQDAALGDLAHADHDRPPTGSFVFGPAFDGTVFIIKDNLLYYCKPKQPEYWPILFFIEVSALQFPGKTGLIHNGQIYYLTEKDIYYIQGSGDGTFLPLKMSAKTGAQSVQGAVSAEGRGILHTGPDGVYLFSTGQDKKITEDALEPIFRGEDVNGIPGVSDMSKSWLWAFKNHLYFGYPDAAHSFPSNIIKLNLDDGRMTYYEYDDGSVVEIRTITTDVTNDRILVGDNSGFVRVIEDRVNTDDSGEDISWEVQSKDFTLQTRAHFPRWVKYDIDVKDGTCKGELLLDGVSHQSHTITGSRKTNRRLVDTGNGSKAAVKITGTGISDFYAAEFE